MMYTYKYVKVIELDAHLGGEGDTFPALKQKSVFEQISCRENAS